jgi:hypothetical protein
MQKGTRKLILICCIFYLTFLPECVETVYQFALYPPAVRYYRIYQDTPNEQCGLDLNDPHLWRILFRMLIR